MVPIWSCALMGAGGLAAIDVHGDFVCFMNNRFFEECCVLRLKCLNPHQPMWLRWSEIKIKKDTWEHMRLKVKYFLNTGPLFFHFRGIKYLSFFVQKNDGCHAVLCHIKCNVHCVYRTIPYHTYDILGGMCVSLGLHHGFPLQPVPSWFHSLGHHNSERLISGILSNNKRTTKLICSASFS